MSHHNKSYADDPDAYEHPIGSGKWREVHAPLQRIFCTTQIGSVSLKTYLLTVTCFIL